jgi:hypothetical protein
VDPYTAACIAADRGILLPPVLNKPIALPDVGCCAPFVNPQPCTLPAQPWPELDLRDQSSPGEEYITTPACDQTAIDETIDLTRAAMALLRANLDLVVWVECLISGFVPRTPFPAVNANLDTMVIGIQQMVMGRTVDPWWPSWAAQHFEVGALAFPTPPSWQLTVIGSRLVESQIPHLEGQQVGGALMPPTEIRSLVPSHGENAMSIAYTAPDPDGTIGVYVATSTYRTANYRLMMKDPTPEVQFCGVAAHAATMLHELTHVWVKLVGFDGPLSQYGYHDRDNPVACWDTARMAKGAFLWAMAQRYSCLSYSALQFLTSGGATVILGGTDGYPCASGPPNPAAPLDAYPCPASGGGGGGLIPPRGPLPPILAPFPGQLQVPWSDGPLQLFDGAVVGF